MGRKPEGKAESLFKNLGKKIDELIEEVKTGSESIRHSERFEELKRNRDQLKKDFEGFKDNHKDAIKDIEDSFDRAKSEIKKAFPKSGKNKKEA
jgi:seryl-tRNA synthetase